MAARDLETSLTAEETQAPAPRRRLCKVALAAASATAVVGALASQVPRQQLAGTPAPIVSSTADDPNWGCGLVGQLPGISQEGTAAADTQRLIDGIKGSSTFGKVSYWNWNLAPQTDDGFEEHLTKDFIFMPEQWGADSVSEEYVRTANQANFLDANGKVCPATMADIFLGTNEPDIYGSCMGNMFGSCLKPCDDQAVASNDCPVAYLSGHPRAQANEKNECNCWQYSHATGAGFWSLEGCSASQPLPKLFDDAGCVNTVMANWRKQAQIVQSKGYKYLSTPLVAENMDYLAKFVEAACTTCQDISCGCPQYLAFHFYAYDCQPEADGGYATFQQRLDAAKALMEKHSFLKGAIINEVGMLNCAGQKDNPICVPDSGKYPASKGPNHECPKNAELPNGLATFVEKVLDMVIAAKTSDGRGVVKGFSWFNLNMAGGTYNLRLFDDDGKLNDVGKAYIAGCSKWGEAQRGALSK